MMRGCAVPAFALVVCAASASADREDVDVARVDWAAGRVTAGGTGIADRHAPSPAVALGTSRRGAEAAARKRLTARVASLPLARGGTLASRLIDPAIKARVDAAIDAAVAIAAEPETDGSWHVTLAVPLEAIRLALAEPRRLAPTGDVGPPVIVVEGMIGKPAIDCTIGGASNAVIWVKDIPAWAKDAPRVKARSARGGAIEVDAKPGGPATLYVLVSRS